MAVKPRRQYANFFDWPGKVTKEMGIVNDLLVSMEQTRGRRFHSVRPGPDPNQAPDCTALTTAGLPVAFEVVELVSEEAVRANLVARLPSEAVYRDWSPGEVVEQIDRILAKKDTKTYHGGPYWYIGIVIHTDERVLRCDEVAPALTGREPRTFDQIDCAFLLFSPEPVLGRCPYIALPVRRQRQLRRFAQRSHCLFSTMARRFALYTGSRKAGG